MNQSADDLHYAFMLALAKCRLRLGNLTLRDAAPVVGVHFGHLHKVVTGARHSASLLARIERLPARKPTDTLTKPQTR